MIKKLNHVNILITGGTGLIGRHLTKLLLQKGHNVTFLSRRQESIRGVKVFQWNPETEYIDSEALKNINSIVHLAGAGIADKRWTVRRKQEIIDSRVKTIALLNKHLQQQGTQIQSFISASGISYYGTDTGEQIMNEDSEAGNDFLAACTVLWEDETRRFSQASRTVSIRTGMVLSNDGGALPKLSLPVRFGVGAAMGSGKQWVPWIHIDDICHLYLQCIENNQIQGAYNAVAPEPVRNETFTKTLSTVLKRPLWLPNVPGFFLRIVLGEMSKVLLGGNHIRNKRMADELAFQYRFPDLHGALKDLLR